jgi:hypothetical protein
MGGTEDGSAWYGSIEWRLEVQDEGIPGPMRIFLNVNMARIYSSDRVIRTLQCVPEFHRYTCLLNDRVSHRWCGATFIPAL